MAWQVEWLTPLKMFVKNMLTHVHKVIHLVVGTFAKEKSLESMWILGEEKEARRSLG